MPKSKANHRQPEQVPLSLSPRSAATWRALRSHPGRITAGALLASFIGHLLILYIAPLREREIAGEAHSGGSAASIASQGMQVVVVAPRRSIHPTERPELPVSAISVAPIAIDDPANSAGGAAADSVAETPARNPLVWNGYSDPRLAVGLLPLAPEQALAAVRRQPKGYVSPLQQCYASIDAHVARARRAQDFSRKDRRGWRWGLSADGIHVGPVTVPIRSGRGAPAESNWRPPRDPCVDD